MWVGGETYSTESLQMPWIMKTVPSATTLAATAREGRIVMIKCFGLGQSYIPYNCRPLTRINHIAPPNCRRGWEMYRSTLEYLLGNIVFALRENR